MINSLQHIGQGVWDIDKTFEFYKKYFGYKIKINDITIADEDMAQVIGSVESIRTLMAINARGGGVLELVEHKSSPIKPYSEDVLYGNYGILEVGYGATKIEDVVSDFKSRGIKILAPLTEITLLDERIWRYFYLRDPDGMILQLIEEIKPGGSKGKKAGVQGVVHACVGVSDLDRSKMFYKSVLGFDKLLYEYEGHIQGIDQITREQMPMKVAILERSDHNQLTDNFLPAGIVKLIEVPGHKGRHIYKGRRWGDIGCMELSFDVSNLEDIIADINSKGVEIYLPPIEINMGSGSKGTIAYIRDPDGTVIELVEIKSVAWLSAASFRRFAIPLLKIYDKLTE